MLSEYRRTSTVTEEKMKQNSMPIYEKHHSKLGIDENFL